MYGCTTVPVYTPPITQLWPKDTPSIYIENLLNLFQKGVRVFLCTVHRKHKEKIVCDKYMFS